MPISNVSLSLLVAMVAIHFAAPVVAQTFAIQGGTGNVGCTGATSFDLSGSSPLSASGACNAGFAQTSGSSRADFGSLGIKAEGNSSNADSRFATWSSASRFEDVVLFTSIDPLATQALVSVFLDVHGVLEGGSISPFGGGGTASIQGSLSLGARRSVFNFSPDSSFPVTVSDFDVVSGSLSVSYGVPIDLRLQSIGVMVPLNQPVSFSLTLGNRVAVSGPGITARSNFLNSFEIPLGVNAFELPDGVQANSGSWLINNQRVLVSVVPEPSSWLLMMLGFGLVSAVFRRQATVL